MKNKAFTLIELLVVVLIIGILASIAVPKYMVATRTAKVRGYMPILKSLHEAQKMYFLAHNTYTSNISDLDVDVDYIKKEEKPIGNKFYNEYTTSWGTFKLYPHSSNIDSTLDIGIHLGLYGQSLDHPEQNSYWICFNDDAVCSKLGGEIYIPAENHSTGTNVYYITM